MENQALRNKIKMLEKLIHDKKSNKDNKHNNNSNINMTANKNNKNNINNTNNKKYLLSTNNKNKNDNNEQISNLEKEVTMLKKYLMNNEELGSDIGSIQGGQDWISTQGDIYNNIYNMSAYKPSLISNLRAIRGSESAIKSIYFNSPVIPRQHQSEFYNNSNLNQIEGYNNNLKRNLCMTEMRLPTNYTNKNYFHSAIRNTAPQNNNFIFGSNTKFPMPDLNNNNNYDNTNNDFLIKENEELKKNLHELKKTYYDVVQSKEQQIILLNQNHDMTLENCEKLIKEAESNYMNLKTEYEQVIEKIKAKDNELDELKQKNLNQDSSLNYYKTELNKMKELNYACDIEAKYNSLLEENIKLKQKEEEETSKLKEENILLKKNIDMIDNKYKEKCKELIENNKKNNEDKKQIEKELQKCKIELKNYKTNPNKKSIKNPNLNNINNISNDKIKEYEEQINKLIEENTQYKTSIEKIEKTQIVEYQKLLDDCFAKISQLTQELTNSKDKNKYLEKALNIVEKKSINDNLIFSPPLPNNNNNLELIEQKENKINENINKNKTSKINTSNGRKELSNGDKDFLNKKRKPPSSYQSGTNKNSGIIHTPNKENNSNNILNQEFSNFEI
jgi:DNA repair exonuclease SbcCD ATPase subunit